jgi:uncharacterized membrane protein YgaE (UPF0421/DUF939 family)
MAEVTLWRRISLERLSLQNSARTAVAALLSLIVARLVGLPEAYWAPITTLIIMQSTLGAALAISGRRLLGTALGAALGALLASYFGPNMFIFAAGVFVAGIFCAAVKLDRSAYRYASITLAIVMLIARPQPAWIIATHRFAEVSIGIAVGLILTSIWPENPT